MSGRQGGLWLWVPLFFEKFLCLLSLAVAECQPIFTIVPRSEDKSEKMGRKGCIGKEQNNINEYGMSMKIVLAPAPWGMNNY